MKDRIKSLMKHMEMSQKEFANEICISEGTLSSIFNGRNRPTLNTLNNIHERFPEVNMDWLMNGNGEMFTSPAPAQMQVEANEGTSPTVPQQPSGIPIQPGFMEQLTASMQLPPQTPNFAPDGKNLDKPMRRIAEIRVFYDDGTFETFSAKQGSFLYQMMKLSPLSNEKCRNMHNVPIFFVPLHRNIYNNVYEEVRFGPSRHVC